MHSALRGSRNLFWVMTVVMISQGCSDGLVRGSVENPEDILHGFSVSPRAIAMAVDDTVYLTPKPTNILGNALSIPDTLPVQFTSSDPALVSVSAEGMLIGRMPTFTGADPVRIIAEWRYRSVRRVDTAYVVVTASRPAAQPNRLLVQPYSYPVDSTWLGAQLGGWAIPTAVLTTDGDTLNEVFVHLSTDRRRTFMTDVIGNPQNMFSPLFPPGAKVWIYGTVRAYGVELSDSVQYTITDPVANFVTLDLAFKSLSEDRPVRVSPCGTFVLLNKLDKDITITWEHPEAMPVCDPTEDTSHVDHVMVNQQIFRRFKNPGRYNWSASRRDGIALPKPIRGTVQIRSHAEL